MAPLPCSPVSNSTASEQSTHPSEESDDSLITPRPGPSDPLQRTLANLSRPLIPTHLALPSTDDSDDHDDDRPVLQASHVQNNQSHDGRPRNPFTYGTDSRRQSTRSSEQRVEFHKPRNFPHSPSLTPARDMDGSSAMSPRQKSTSESPRRRQNYSQETESSADENTGMVRPLHRSSSRSQGYGATHMHNTTAGDESVHGYDGAAEEEVSTWRKKSSANRSRAASAVTSSSGKDDSRHKGSKGWLLRLADRYGSVELENKGSVARDHLALERTFLAWVRTSLSFASIGIAVTQLFRLNTALNSPASNEPTSQSQKNSRMDKSRLQSVGKPLGATFIGISILILLLGFHRFFESQHYVIRGKFPASRGSIILVSLVTVALIIASFVVVIVVAPSIIET